MKIVKLTVRNYLGVEHFVSDRLGKLNKITGGNGVGKTTLVKAIREAFKARGHDPEVIRVGADKAEIIIELTDGLQVERVITPGENRPKVVLNGVPMKSPAKYLADLVGAFNFNPVEFFLAPPKDRRTVLLSSIPFTINEAALKAALEAAKVPVPVSLSGFDYTRHGLEVLEAIQNMVYDARAEQNRCLTQLKKAVEQEKAEMPATFDAEKFRSFDVQKVAQALADAKVSVAEHARDIEKLDALRHRSASIVAKIEELKAEITRLEGERASVADNGRQLRAQIEGFVAPPIAQLEADMAEYKQSERIAHKLESIDKRNQEIEAVENTHEALDRLHKALMTDVPRKMLSQVKLPVENLEIKGDSIFVDGVSIDKLSTSEQIEFAITVAKSLAGNLKVICVDRWESLDADAKAKFEALTADDDFEYFVTEVTSGDLSVAAAPQRTAAAARPTEKTKTATPARAGADF